MPEKIGGAPLPNSVDPATTVPGAGTGSGGTSAADEAPQVDPSMAEGTRTTADPASPTAVPGANPTAGTGGDASMATGTAPADTTAAPATTAADGGWRSYESVKDQFKGEITGGFTADDLIGADVVDQDGKSVGEVSDLVVGSDEKVQHVVVDVGGFLGMGEKPVAIQLDQLKKGDDTSTLMVTMSKDEIENLPSVSKDDEGMFSTSS